MLLVLAAKITRILQLRKFVCENRKDSPKEDQSNTCNALEGTSARKYQTKMKKVSFLFGILLT